MRTDPEMVHADQIPFRSLTVLLLITFGLAWGMFLLFVLFPEQIAAVFGELSGQHPLFILAVYSPAIAAFIIMTQQLNKTIELFCRLTRQPADSAPQ